MVPVLVRDGKACHAGMVPTSSHGCYTGMPGGTDIYSSSATNGRLSSYSSEASFPPTSPTPTTGGSLGMNGLPISYATSPGGPLHSPAQAIDHFNPHTFHHHHNQLTTQQFGAAYSPPTYGPAYAVAATYSTNYKPHQIQQKWAAW